VTKHHPYLKPANAELARWPGVSYSRRRRSKHMALVLAFGGAERFVVYPLSPSDGAHGLKNHLADVRAELAGMGAVRETKGRLRVDLPRSAQRSIARPVVRPKPLPKVVIVETALSRDPWAALVGWASRVFGTRANV
jgi:hypothetical protein